MNCRLVLAIAIIIIPMGLRSQMNNSSDKSIDFDAIDTWTKIKVNGNNIPIISNDGQYVFYITDNLPKGKITMTVQATSGFWKKEFIRTSITNKGFAADSKHFYFACGKDSLAILTLGTDRIEYLPDVTSFEFLRFKDVEYLACRSLNPQVKFINTITNRTFTFNHTINFSQFGTQELILIKDSANFRYCCLLKSIESKPIELWKGSTLGNIVIDPDHQRCVFIGTRLNDNPSLWSFQKNDTRAKELISTEALAQTGYTFSGINSFGKSGKSLFYYVKKKNENEFSEKLSVTVNVWSTNDPMLLREQEDLNKRIGERRYKALFYLESKQVVSLERGDTSAIYLNKADMWALFTGGVGSITEGSWNSSINKTIHYLIDGRQFKKIRIGKLSVRITADNSFPTISPSGKYLIYHDINLRCFKSYEVATGRERRISDIQTVNFGLDETIYSPESVLPVANGIIWNEPTDHFSFSDNYDFWELDPSGKTPPFCITKGFGRRHRIQLRLLAGAVKGIYPFSTKETLLTGYQDSLKQYGILKLKNNATKNIQYLMLSDGYLGIPSGRFFLDSPPSFPPLKAANAAAYIFIKSTAEESTNLFFTRDFKKVIPISNNYPEKNYRWLKAELIHYKLPDGKSCQGILYRPARLNPTRQYPVIVTCYEQVTANINVFPIPEKMSGNVNVPWMVSQDYIVFVPDILYKWTETGKSALESVLAGVNVLSRLPYVNPLKIGIQGHSFGSFEINYIITHSNKFAAALTCSGSSDMINTYGTVASTFESRGPFVEFSQYRMKKSLWEIPGKYIDNSPVFYVDKITTPVLMMHNINDEAVPFTHALEFFTFLRRAGKKAWLLQYDKPGMGHVITEKFAQEDFTLRTTQFFDHYLKGKPCPLWMLDDMSAENKGTQTGLQLDSLGRTPENILLTEEEKKNIERNSKIPMKDKLKGIQF